MAQDIGRELEWDDVITGENSNFEPLPEGDYNFTVDHFERSRSSGGGKLPPCNMAIVYFNVRGQGREMMIRENYVMHSTLEWKLSELFMGVGLLKEGETLSLGTLWKMLAGRTGKCKVGLKPGIKDPSKMFNFIDRLYPKENNFDPGRF